MQVLVSLAGTLFEAGRRAAAGGGASLEDPTWKRPCRMLPDRELCEKFNERESIVFPERAKADFQAWYVVSA